MKIFILIMFRDQQLPNDDQPPPGDQITTAEEMDPVQPSVNSIPNSGGDTGRENKLPCEFCDKLFGVQF